MNTTEKLDQWYKEWAGHSHPRDSNQKIFDSSDMQDFARYCFETAISELHTTAKAEMKIKLDIPNHIDQLRVVEAMAIKGVSRVTIFKHKKKGTFNWTKNELIINDEKFKNWIPKKHTPSKINKKKGVENEQHRPKTTINTTAKCRG